MIATILDCFSLAAATISQADDKQNQAKQGKTSKGSRSSLYAFDATEADVPASTSIPCVLDDPTDVLDLWSDNKDTCAGGMLPRGTSQMSLYKSYANLSSLGTIMEEYDECREVRKSSMSARESCPAGLSDCEFPSHVVAGSRSQSLSALDKSDVDPSVASRGHTIDDFGSESGFDWSEDDDDDEDDCDLFLRPHGRRLASVFNVARRWNISAEDAAELMENVEQTIQAQQDC